MTTITLEPNRLSVAGHAGYGKVGYDIVCAREKPNNNITTKTRRFYQTYEFYILYQI